MRLLPNELKTFKYYLNKLPLYLQNSEGFQEHFRIWYDMLAGESIHTGASGVCDSILQLLNIFDDDYLDYVAGFENSGAIGSPGRYSSYGSRCDMLDKIGDLFNIKRTFTLTYTDVESVTHNNVNISLNNQEFLSYIKFQIIKSACEGTREQILNYYKEAGLTIYLVNQSTSGVTYIYLRDDDNVTSNLKILFLAGELLVKPMGVRYDFAPVDFQTLLIFDRYEEGVPTNGWDIGRWAI